MALDFLLGDTTNLLTHDNFVPDNKNFVTFYCPSRSRLVIRGILSGSFGINGSSKWNSVIASVGSAMGSQVIDTIDNFAQGLFGNTIRQPWFGRKFWQGTQPLTFNLTVQFLSFNDAKAEVFDPMMRLLSLVFPRLDSNSDTANLLQKYFIPGPTMFYSPNSNFADKGDRVEIRMGDFLYFKGCYITEVALTVENSFSLSGFPHNVKATVKFETMDVSYVKNDGKFMEDGFRDASIQLNGWLQKLVDTVRPAAEKAADFVGFKF